MHRKRYQSEWLFEGMVYLITTLMVLMSLLPLIHVLALSFSSKMMSQSGQVSFWPKEFTLSAYQYILRDGQYIESFGVSVLRTVVGTALQLATTIMMAYPMSLNRRQFPSRNRYMTYLLFSMMFGGGLVPWYLVVSGLGLTNSFASLIIPFMVTINSMILMMNYFRNLPKELSESAQIDGAGYMQIMSFVYLPCALPIIATVVLFSAVGFWNDYFNGMILETRGKWIPLQTYIRSLEIDKAAAENASILNDPQYAEMLEQVSGRNFTSAKLSVATLPLLMVYPFVQKYFVTGITLGAVKE